MFSVTPPPQYASIYVHTPMSTIYCYGRNDPLDECWSYMKAPLLTELETFVIEVNRIIWRLLWHRPTVVTNMQCTTSWLQSHKLRSLKLRDPNIILLSTLILYGTRTNQIQVTVEKTSGSILSPSHFGTWESDITLVTWACKSSYTA